MTAQSTALNFDLMSDMKASPVADGVKAMLAGKTAIGDGLGGSYRWDPAASGTDDRFMNSITSDTTTTGRWIRLNQRARDLPHGVLILISGIKTFYGPVTTNSSGETTIYLTNDGTATGTALFTEVWSEYARSTMNATGVDDAVLSFKKSLSTDLRTLVHGYGKGNAITLVGGLLYKPIASVGAGITAQVTVVGA